MVCSWVFMLAMHHWSLLIIIHVVLFVCLFSARVPMPSCINGRPTCNNFQILSLLGCQWLLVAGVCEEKSTKRSDNFGRRWPARCPWTYRKDISYFMYFGLNDSFRGSYLLVAYKSKQLFVNARRSFYIGEFKSLLVQPWVVTTLAGWISCFKQVVSVSAQRFCSLQPFLVKFKPWGEFGKVLPAVFGKVQLKVAKVQPNWFNNPIFAWQCCSVSTLPRSALGIEDSIAELIEIAPSTAMHMLDRLLLTEPATWIRLKRCPF